MAKWDHLLLLVIVETEYRMIEGERHLEGYLTRFLPCNELVLDKLATYGADLTLAGEGMGDDNTFRHIRCECYLLTKISGALMQIVSQFCCYPLVM